MKYICSWSGGKDSTAQIILAHEHNEPLDLIIFSEVMFDENISGELPEHIEFIHKCVPLFESWGYEVNILHSDKTYLDMFYHVIEKPIKNHHFKGMIAGFPMTGKCAINRDLKIKPINEFYASMDATAITQYVGIAVDEPKRLARLEGNKVSLLEKYNYTEQMAYELCEKYNLLSPVYQFSKRGGCWFCPNARQKELRHLYNHHRDLWNKLLELEKIPNKIDYCWNTLTKTSITQIDENFKWEDAQMTIFDYGEQK